MNETGLSYQKVYYRYVLKAMVVLMGVAPMASSVDVSAKTYLDLHLVSYHTERRSSFNESNPGLFIRDERERFFYVFGGFHNSENRLSALGGFGRMLGDGFFRASGTIGLVSGYEQIVVMALVSGHAGSAKINVVYDPYNEQLVFSWGVDILEW